ncbi:MAG: hypothetical protein PHP00_01930 [Thiotrichaceae bacterium]|nr:hypothetical protein [Thiotrichaceae bacterium]
MHAFALFFKLCRLQLKPHQLPYSYSLLAINSLLYMFISVVSALIAFTVEQSWLYGFLDMSLQIILVSSLLTVMGHQERIVQTLTALFGANNILSLLMLPANYFSYQNHTVENLEGFADVLLLGLFLWLMIITAHIMRHAVGGSRLIGLMIAFLIALFSGMALQQVFPQG